MEICEIKSDLEAIKNNSALFSEDTSFRIRAETIDYIEFNIIYRIEGLLNRTNQLEELIALKQSAQMLINQLEKLDNNFFQYLRAEIRTGFCNGIALKNRIEDYVNINSKDSQPQDVIGYDSLDVFINGLLLINPIPTETKKREPDMVHYQQTPSRIIFELVEKANFTREDVFYDIGSGLGQVSVLINLLGEVAAKGIEFEPAYSNYARECASELNLSRVEFINVDARKADYSNGTVFFMYTPFKGKLLEDVLSKLESESQRRNIKLFTYGPCTPLVGRQSWLKRMDKNGSNHYKLGEFKSL